MSLFEGLLINLHAKLNNKVTSSKRQTAQLVVCVCVCVFVQASIENHIWKYVFMVKIILIFQSFSFKIIYLQLSTKFSIINK